VRRAIAPSGATPRLALLGAFPFPLPQGSQTYVRDQARALAAAGAGVSVLCYGRGAGVAPPDLDLVRIPAALSPRALRSGPSLGKPLADAALLAAYVTAHRRRRFDAALAHNAEAALVAIAARPLTGVPVVYVAHTLMALELASFGPRLLGSLLRGAGLGIDRWIARSADAIVALCRPAARRLEPHARAPVAVIPPGLDPEPDPDPATVAAVCERSGVEAGRFALYAGNLDRYQNLAELERAARRIPEIPVVVATHDAAHPDASALRFVCSASPQEVRALTFAAGVAVLPRRQPGGFPVKLLNYMEARRAIVARAEVAEGLEHDRTAWLLAPEADDDELAGAIRMLLADRARAERLGRAARTHLEAHHGWSGLARRTLAVTEKLPGRRR
jgi:glycosyltransferase involved in cell wall biosynthesis